ncbi:Flp family type IVb pilin [Eubacteriaceae bacterium ES2]|nr:Flp family type IVb pilin [Eubacteriaceae bacterium ES2]
MNDKKKGKLFPDLLVDEKGQGIVEYGLIIALAVVTFVLLIGPSVATFFTQLATVLAEK